jgi:hypothetical protein
MKMGLQIRMKWRPNPEVVADCGDEPAAACLSRAVSQGVSLHAADLSRLDLQGADLHGADLTNADLVGTDLRGADLAGADARWANFDSADLRGANLNGLFTYQTNLYGVQTEGDSLDQIFKYTFPPLDVHQVTVKDPAMVDSYQSVFSGKEHLKDYLEDIVDSRGAVREYRTERHNPGLDKNIFDERVFQLTRWIQGRVGQDIGPSIGTGHHGSAYDLGDGRVLKVTTDEKEFKAMSILRGMNHPNITQVHDTFVLRTPPRERRDEVNANMAYFIVRGRTGPILADIPEHERLSRAIREIGLMVSQNYYGDLRFSMEAEIYDWKSLRKRFKGKERKILDGVIAAAEALHDAGIYTIDIHPKNIGMVDGRPVLFDVGNSWMPEHTQVPVDLIFHTTRNEANRYFRDLDQKGALLED